MGDDPKAQSALDAWGSSDGDDDEEEVDSEPPETDVEPSRWSGPRSPFADPAISDDAVLTDYSCPWCLHPAEEFRLKYADDFIGEPMRNPLVSCGNCSACIPVETDWYQRGEKICVRFTAQEYQGLDTEPIRNDE